MEAMDRTDIAVPDSALVTSHAIRGRATGALFFLGFGAIWMFVGLKQTHHASQATLLPLGLVCAGLLALTGFLVRRARDLPGGNRSAEEDARTQRMFNAVNIIQWVSVATAIVILNVLHLPDYIVPSIAVIVGLHLFPLAAAFHYLQHYVTGTLLVLWPLLCLGALPRGRVSGVCAVGVAAILLLSTASTLLRALASIRSSAPAQVIA